MRKGKRPALVIFSGAFLGAAIVAGINFALPASISHRSDSAERFVLFIQLVFGHLAKNPALFLIVCGAITGAVTGLFLAGIIPNPKMWLGILSAFIVGIIVGGAALYFPGEKLLERNEAISECRILEERAQSFLDASRAIHRGTNSLSLFQANGRFTLANFVHDADRFNDDILDGNMFTNSATYEQAGKYLAEH